TRNIRKVLRACEDAGGSVSECFSSEEEHAEKNHVSKTLETAYGICANICKTAATPLTGNCAACTAPTHCIELCDQQKSDAKLKAIKKVNACVAAVRDEISAGVKCEAARGWLYDLPANFPVSRKAWAACWAYSDGCHPRCQPKQGYLQVLPTGNQLTYIAHYGLDAECRPTPPNPALWAAFLKTSANNRYDKLADYACLASVVGVQGSQFETKPFFNLLQTVASTYAASSLDKSCPAIPLKPSKDLRDSIDLPGCHYSVQEKDVQRPGVTRPENLGETCKLGGAAGVAGALATGGVQGALEGIVV
ncbi:MAG: hypothetical protein AABW54_00065, partial [Candidatus Micrarchaeota archaeon]